MEKNGVQGLNPETLQHHLLVEIRNWQRLRRLAKEVGENQ